MGLFILMRLAAIVMLLSSAIGFEAQAKDIAVVAGEGFPAASLTREEVRDIFLGEIELVKGARVRPLDVKEQTGVRRFFFKTILGVSEDGYQAYWIKKIFQDGGSPPVTLPSPDTLAQMLNADKTALGFIWAEVAAKTTGIKVLFVISVKE